MALKEGNVVTFFFLFASMVVFCVGSPGSLLIEAQKVELAQVCVLNLFIAVHGEAACQLLLRRMAVGQNQWDPILVGEFTTHFSLV